VILQYIVPKYTALVNYTVDCSSYAYTCTSYIVFYSISAEEIAELLTKMCLQSKAMEGGQMVNVEIPPTRAGKRISASSDETLEITVHHVDSCGHYQVKLARDNPVTFIQLFNIISCILLSIQDIPHPSFLPKPKLSITFVCRNVSPSRVEPPLVDTSLLMTTHFSPRSNLCIQNTSKLRTAFVSL
jgi:hypothetical protein